VLLKATQDKDAQAFLRFGNFPGFERPVSPITTNCEDAGHQVSAVFSPRLTGR